MAAILKLARLQFVGGGLFVYIFGAVLALTNEIDISVLRVLLGYLVVFPAHLAVSFSNDYFDAAQDAAGKPAFFNGGSGVLVRHPHLRSGALWAAILLGSLSMLSGWLYVDQFSLPIWFLALALAGNLSGWVYSAPPLRLAARGLGEPLAGLTVGVLVPLCGYVAAAGQVSFSPWPVWTAMFLYNTAFIAAVAIPDIEADRLGGKRTWAVRFGARRVFQLVGVFFFSASLLFALTFAFHKTPGGSDLGMLVFPSLLPLGAWLLAARHIPESQPERARAVLWIVLAMIVFLVYADAWLIAAVVH